jgi:integrase
MEAAMATIRKRSWTTASGEPRESWQVDFVDQNGKRRHKQFARKKDADQFLVTARGQVQSGVYTPDSTSATVEQAIDLWLDRSRAEGLERSTLEQREKHRDHILAAIDGSTKLSRLTTARCEQLRDHLLKAHSRAMARKLLVNFKAAIKDAKRRGLIASNPAADTAIGAAKRHKARLAAGRDFPTPAEVQAMLKADKPKARAMVALAALAGLRASELRALRWSDIDLGTKPAVTVSQRADKWAQIGSPKSDAAKRTIPLGQTAAQALRAWKLAQPPVAFQAASGARQQRPHELVFGTRTDRPDLLANLQRRVLGPLQVAAGITRGPQINRDGKPVLDSDGKPVIAGKYSPHALRHYAVSSWLAIGIDLKQAQSWAGHAALALTLDTYGHLIPRADAHARIAAAETLLAT